VFTPINAQPTSKPAVILHHRCTRHKTPIREAGRPAPETAIPPAIAQPPINSTAYARSPRPQQLKLATIKSLRRQGIFTSAEDSADLQPTPEKNLSRKAPESAAAPRIPAASQLPTELFPNQSLRRRRSSTPNYRHTGVAFYSIPRRNRGGTCNSAPPPPRPLQFARIGRALRLVTFMRKMNRC